MYTSKIGSDSFRLAVERFVSALSQYMPETKISCDKGSGFDQFNITRDMYAVKIKYKIKPHKYTTIVLTVSDNTCTCEDYDRGCNVYLLDAYAGIAYSWNLMLDCPGYTGNQVARYIQDSN